MLTMRDVLVEELRRKEARSRARYGRFVRYATNQKPIHMTLGDMAGRRLVAWGRTLQARCAAHCDQPPAWKKAYYRL